MTLLKNMVFEWTEKPGPDSMERVLWLGESNIVWTIKIYGKNSPPLRRSREDIESALDTGAARILSKDPFAHLVRSETDIKKTHREHRDKAWAMIESLVQDNSPELFEFHGRNSPIIKLTKSRGFSKSTVYRNIRHYWQRGQSKNALLPLYDNCGWRDRLDEKKKRPTKSRRSAEQSKLGRQSKLALARGETLGVNVTNQIRSAFKDGIRLFYEKRTKQTLRTAYELTLGTFFNCGYERDRNGVWVAQLPPTSELPSFRQFKYWYHKDRIPSRSRISRDGAIRYKLSGRAKLGDSTRMAAGPGAIFQGDATVGDVYLVSSFNRNWIIGRPIIYFIIDVFSRLIVGLGVALEGPSWLGLMLALENAATDKVSFCQEFDLKIDPSEWPAFHMPEVLMGDRGELEGFNANQLVAAFNTRADNTPPWRADLKGIVESLIRTTNLKTIHWVPGRVRKRERGDRDHRLDAKLTLHEFRKILILTVIEHNLHKRLDDYPLNADMIADGVEPYPIELWNWGIQNRSGHLRAFDKDIVRLNLLPEGEATVTQNGLLFEGLGYRCELAEREEWFQRAGERKTWKVKVAHDPRTSNQIYLRLDNGRRLETCYLLPKYDAFKNREWYEVRDELELRAQRKEASQTRQLRSGAHLRAATKDVVDRAEEAFKANHVEMSNRARVSSIRENRKRERDHERNVGAWQLGKAPRASDASKHQDLTGYVPPPQPTQKLRRLRERRVTDDSWK